MAGLAAEPGGRWTGSRVAGGSGLLGALLGGVVLIAYWLALPLQSRLFPGSVPMRPNAALCFVLLGTALLGVRQGGATTLPPVVLRACCALAGLVALLSLLQPSLSFDLAIDGLLVGRPRPAPMSPLTAGVLLCLALALGLSSLGMRATRGYQGLLGAAGLLTLLPLLGYVYRAPIFYQVGQPSAVAPATVLGLVLLLAGCVAARVDEGLWPLLVGGTPGSLLIRRGLPAVFGLPVLFGWVRVQVAQHAPVAPQVAAGVTAALTVVTFFALLLWAASRLRAQDLERRVAVAGLQGARSTLEARVEERTRVLKQTDIELRRAASQLLVAKEAAEAATRARADFLARMSHEMRTPLNGVVGMLEIALRSELAPAQRDYVLTARTSAESLLSLINDILDFSKIDAGKLSLSSMPFRLRDCLGTALRESAHTAHQKGLELFLSPAADVPDCLIGDPGRLRQVISNLVSNAVKFTSKGEVRVEVAADGRKPGSVALAITVSDTGVGIAADKQSEIFEAFAQADESTTRRYGGTGLGLAVSAQLVQLMDGQIGVDSAEGQGSRFFITLTLAVDEEAEHARSAQPRAFAGKRALLVEPHPAHRALLCELLEELGIAYLVCPAGALLKQLEQAREDQQSFALLIADDDAISEEAALLPALRELVGESFPVLLMTRATAPDAARQDRLVLASAQLTKPVVAGDLLETVHGLLSESKLEPEQVSLPSDAAPLRVLLAEDNEVNRRVACFLLEDAGYSVVAVENGREALAELWEGRFDVVLMDGHMPEMDGIEATRQQRERERVAGAPRIPIVALTAQAMKGDRERYLAAGMDAYVTKPFQAAQLLSTLREVVGRSPPESPRQEREKQRVRLGSRPTATPLRPTARLSLAPPAPPSSPAPEPARPASVRPASLPPAAGPSYRPPARRASLAPPAREVARHALQVYQRSHLLDRLRGQERVLRTMVTIFDEEVGDMFGTLSGHVDSANAEGLELAAHKLAGALLTVGAELAAATARRLELAGRVRDLVATGGLRDTLREQLAALRQAFLRAGDLPEDSRSAL